MKRIAVGWKRAESKAKHTWTNLTDSALATITGWRDSLVGAFQQGSGSAKASAEREFAGLRPALAPVPISDIPKQRF